jgi:hypothetical protein
MVDISELVRVTFVWDATLGSPAELQSYGGLVVAMPPAMIPLPDRGELFGVGGYSRTDGTGGWQWVIQGETDPVDAFVDSLTGRGGWANQSSRTLVKTLVARLFSAGIPRQTIATQIPQFYSAIAAEIASEQATG